MHPQATTADVAAVLAHVTAGLPAHEDRPGQLRMAELVAEAIRSKTHLIVQAGTGTGKTLAYLVGAIVMGKKLVVATATKALQDQLATKDLPFVEARLAELGHDFGWAVLKGRSNYLCLQRLREANNASGQDALDLGLGDDARGHVLRGELKRLSEWAGESSTGDQAELDWSPSDPAWKAVSVGSDECPGATRCPLGEPCFAEKARRQAQAADVIVVNTHLYGLNVGSGGAILPEHDVVVFDEAHVIEDVMSDTVGVQLAPGRFAAVAGAVRRIISDQAIESELSELVPALRDALAPHAGTRLSSPFPPAVDQVLEDAEARLTRAGTALSGMKTDNEDAKQRQLRAQQLTTRALEAVQAARAVGDTQVPFVSGRADFPVLEIAPLDVGPTMAAGVWGARTAILTSATIPGRLAERVGLPAERTTTDDVGSPFDYAQQALLYCAMHLPRPNVPGFRDAVADELVALIEAAGGRTLALFTSWAAMDDAVAKVRDRVSYEILTQRDLPKPALVARFAASAETCLFATTGLFQGVDVPGDTLSCVVIDKLPFPRPDDPLLSARREQLGPKAFSQIDVPRAATLLAQACGRLVRSRTDRGVVAVLDPRLGSATYRWDIVSALPPMRRTRQRADAEAFLRELRA